MFDKKEWDRKYYAKNKEKIKERKKISGKKYRENNPEKIKAKNKIYYDKNKEKACDYSKQWAKNNPKKKRERNERYRVSEKGKANLSKYIRNKIKTNPKFKLKDTMGTAIYRSLKGNKAGRHWEDLVGYSLDDLIKSLKQTIPTGYEWKDYIDGKLHLDHIIPISAYEFDKPEDFQFKECWSLKNLRLLPAKENIIKSDKIIKSYQLALKI